MVKANSAMGSLRASEVEAVFFPATVPKIRDLAGQVSFGYVGE